MTQENSAKWQSTAWLVVMLLFPVALLNYLDRQMMAAMKASIMGDIPSVATEANWGLLLGLFKWVYAIFSPLGGYIADRFSRRHVIVASLCVWSLITWATGHAQSYDQLRLFRALMGISEACYIPAALALIADFHTGNTRSRAIGVHQMGIYWGIILGGFSGYVADAPNLGWRLAFSACGIVGVLYAVPLFLLLKNAPRQAHEKSGGSLFSSAGELLKNRNFILLVFYFTLPAIAGWVVRDWMPAILKEKFQIGQGMAGVSATLYLQVAAMICAVIGGWMADSWMRRTPRGRIYVSAIGMTCLIPAMFGVGTAGTLAMAIAFLVLFGIGWGFFDCNNMPILSQIVRPHLRATGYGIMNFVSISMGGFADLKFGQLRDQKVPMEVFFGFCSLAAVVSVILVLLIRPQENSATQTT